MTTPLGTLVLRYRTLLTACQRRIAGRCVLAVAAVGAAAPMSAAAQRAEGAIAVSLVITPRVELVPAALARRRVDRDGRATLGSARFVAAYLATGRAMPRRAGSQRSTDQAPVREVPLRKELLVVAGT